jgi:LacI family transcriptional regulator
MQNALAEAEIEFSESLIFHGTADQLGGYRSAQQILNLSERPTAVFTVNNMTAVGVMQALREANVRVPDEIALVCFDDVQHLAVISPFLTVVDQPAETMANVAAQLLLERIVRLGGKKSRNISFPGKLIIRESCGVKLPHQ